MSGAVSTLAAFCFLFFRTIEGEPTNCSLLRLAHDFPKTRCPTNFSLSRRRSFTPDDKLKFVGHFPGSQNGFMARSNRNCHPCVCKARRGDPCPHPERPQTDRLPRKGSGRLLPRSLVLLSSDALR